MTFPNAWDLSDEDDESNVTDHANDHVTGHVTDHVKNLILMLEGSNKNTEPQTPLN
jgi:hypothetical protein